VSFYVKIKRLNGRRGHVILGEWLNHSGVVEVDYHDGGWSDQCVHNLHPHLKFESEEDAIAWVLAHGGSYTTKVPEDIRPEID
jgi:hypothetical protein